VITCVTGGVMGREDVYVEIVCFIVFLYYMREDRFGSWYREKKETYQRHNPRKP